MGTPQPVNCSPWWLSDYAACSASCETSRGYRTIHLRALMVRRTRTTSCSGTPSSLAQRTHLGMEVNSTAQAAASRSCTLGNYQAWQCTCEGCSCTQGPSSSLWSSLRSIPTKRPSSSLCPTSFTPMVCALCSDICRSLTQCLRFTKCFNCYMPICSVRRWRDLPGHPSEPVEPHL